MSEMMVAAGSQALPGLTGVQRPVCAEGSHSVFMNCNTFRRLRREVSVLRM